ncbi:hypothetical protein [Actinobacillus pleuropneumoniae]|uniref:hypothetical protein n=1 Tax=Actinobacillus pleuropneumoniae TaxID=715 RepID=UPI0000397D61|nr:hypothetical protein [Actinobacillus pleuropneumoniae]UKH11288.1 hypothetical protein D1098_05045 [Actinobacillus pleuropneumoniae]VTR45398.1 Uncharacterised protein [Actinobacillus pleuropneumoniae]
MSNLGYALGALTLALVVGGQVTGCQSNDFDGKQTLEQVHCQQAGGDMINRSNGTLFQTEYVCKYPKSQQIPIEFRG